jgi:hypothetical protein|tara:strand:+ start:1523 stop:1672 length:150 start_codon:yes stop_codon:yes gene_type:complete
MVDYNIDEMSLAEMIALWNSIPIADRLDHYLLHLHIVLDHDFDRLYKRQ